MREWGWSRLGPALAVVCLLLVSQNVIAQTATSGLTSLASRLQQEWGASQYEELTLQIPAPARDLVLTIPFEGKSWELWLTRHSLRAPGFEARKFDANRATTSIAPPAVRTYRGFVVDQPEAEVIASFTDWGLHAAIVIDDQVWRVEPAARYDSHVAPQRHVVFRPGPVAFSCGTDVTTSPVPPGAQPFGGVTPTACDVKSCEIAFDCDYEYFLQQGGSEPNTIARVEAIMNDVDFFYRRDLRVTYVITLVLVRTAPFYADISGGTLLDDFRNEWNTNQTGVVRDIAHLMTDKNNLSGYGGLAWVGVVCTNFGYGWSLDSAGIVGHEVGHNWSAGHCHDTSPCNNMCGACLNIGSNTLDIMMAHRLTRTCLDDVAPFVDPLPPYGHTDELRLSQADIVSGSGFAVDVLLNDHDANCDPISVGATPTTSAKGGSVAVSAGTGAGGFDQVIYTPPGTGFSGDDEFEYGVTDGSQTTSTRVTVRVNREDLAGHWPLDEQTGTLAADVSSYGRIGNLVGGLTQDANGEAAVYGRGLVFDGVDDSVEAPALNLYTSSLTITAWVRRDGVQPDFAGLVFSRGGNTVAGLNLGTANELRYHWNGGGWPWSSGLVLTHGQWSFVALVIEPTRARMYLQVGTSGALQVAVNNVAHAVEEFDAALVIGSDPTGGRFFSGGIDDVRVYSYALTQAQIEAVAQGGSADAPRPPHLDNETPRHPVLQWSPGFQVTGQDLYFGFDAAAVAAATPASPEFRGRQSALDLHSLAELAPQSTHHWRVDSYLTDGTTTTGDVWTFTTSDLGYSDDLVFHYTLDNGGIVGTTVVDESGPPFLNGALQGGAPATPGQVGEGRDLDGVNDRIQVPALNLFSNTVTFSAWIRRDGPQSGDNGIIFCRAGSTTAGLNMGSHNELRYHWNGAEWWWDSGLETPDGEWCHVALVIEPDRATLYRNGDAAVRGVSHAIEEFNGPTYVGQDAGFSTRYFGGGIDEVAVWSRALSPAEVRGLHAAGRQGRPIQGDSDVTAPDPSPLTWAQVPTALGTDAIEMLATTATDPSSVEYNFICVTGGGNDSGWQQSPYYRDTGLTPGTTCSYFVVARDLSPNQNETAPSSPESATTDGDIFRRGDANQDGQINIADPVLILGHLFSGTVPGCLAALDTNDSEGVDIADAVSAIDYLFLPSVTTLPAPFPGCGLDPTPGSLSCDLVSGCP